MSEIHRILFEPTTIGSIHVKNRYAMGPMGPLGMSTAEGGWNQRGIDYYVRRAEVQQALEAVVAVDDAPVEVVEVAGGEAAAV